MDDKEVQHKLRSDDDFVNLKRFDFSIAEVERRYPEGAPDHLIAQALGLSETEVVERFGQIVVQLREWMGVDEADADQED